jgi:methylase of polypeptide subunit release factors
MSTEVQTTHLSDQALAAIMMALQNSLLNQTDIVPVLKGLKLTVHPTEGVIVMNPPILRTQPQGETIETSVQ